MADIDKVIKALENCKEGGSCDNCEFNIQSSKCIFLLHSDALELLKEQLKTKVVFMRNSDGFFQTECGNCGTYLDKAYSRCPKCQKELDWNSNQS